MRFWKLFDKTQKIEIKTGLSNPEPWLIDLFGGSPASSGISVTPQNAMQCTPVACAVKAIAETIGQLPVHVYARGADGSKERAPDHPAHALVHDEVNDWTSASEFREKLTGDALLHEQGAFAFINRINGRPVELHRLPPENVTVETDVTTGEPVYRVQEGKGRQHVYSFRDILHLRGLGSPIKQAREAIGLAIVMERHAAKLFGNGARPSGILSFAESLAPEALAKAKAAWQAAHGNGNSGNTAVLEKGAEFRPITLTSVDAQFAELRAFAIAEIARAFRVPPVLLMDYGRATWANGEAMGQQFLTYSLMPWLKRWEAEIRLKLFSPEDREGFFAEFLVDDLLRADFEKRSKSYALLIAARVLNPNEVRAMENRAPYAGGDEFANPNITTSLTASTAQEQPNG